MVDSLRAGTLMREAAMEAGALTVAPNVEVTGIDVVDGAVRGVRTDRGDIACDTVVDRLRGVEPEDRGDGRGARSR